MKTRLLTLLLPSSFGLLGACSDLTGLGPADGGGVTDSSLSSGSDSAFGANDSGAAGLDGSRTDSGEVADGPDANPGAKFPDGAGLEGVGGEGGCVWTLASGTQLQVGFDPSAIAVADFNGDGKPDLAVANSASATVSVLLGNGDGTYQPQLEAGVAMDPLSIAVGDLNGDGKPDVAVAALQAQPGNGTILLGNGDGTFEAPLSFTAGESSTVVAMGDLNLDGKLDLAVNNINSTGLSILLGHGDGTFAPPVSYATGRVPSSVAIADLNGDGTPDVVVDTEEDGLSVLLGVGDGTLRGQTAYATGGFPLGVAVGDLNDDGKPDLVATNSGEGAEFPFSNSVSVLLGNGDGTFQPQVFYGTGASPAAVVIGDLNGDGRPDLAVANEGADGVSVLLGNGDGTFQPQTVFPITSAATSLAVADLNGDGRLDLAVACGVAGSSHFVDILLASCASQTGMSDASASDAAALDASAPVDSADGGAECLAPGVDCGGVCVDIQTDHENCGACNSSCAVPSCAEGKCTTIRLYQGNGSGFPFDIAVDPTNVYFTDNTDGLVVKVPIDGGVPVTLASDASPFYLAIDAVNVYWANGSAVLSVALDGGTAATLASAQGSAGVAIDAQHVYWTTTSTAGTGTVARAALDGGGTPETLAPGQDDPQMIRVTPTGAYWFNSDIDGTSDAGSVMSVPLDGGKSTTLAPWENLGVNSIALDSTYIYWNDSAVRQIVKEPLGGGTGVTLATGMDVMAIAVDATGVYCADRGASGITRVPLDGGQPVLIAPSLELPWRVALDENNVYWSDFADAILKASK